MKMGEDRQRTRESWSWTFVKSFTKTPIIKGVKMNLCCVCKHKKHRAACQELADNAQFKCMCIYNMDRDNYLQYEYNITSAEYDKILAYQGDT